MPRTKWSRRKWLYCFRRLTKGLQMNWVYIVFVDVNGARNISKCILRGWVNDTFNWKTFKRNNSFWNVTVPFYLHPVRTKIKDSTLCTNCKLLKNILLHLQQLQKLIPTVLLHWNHLAACVPHAYAPINSALMNRLISKGYLLISVHRSHVRTKPD